mmetsp:Transcript_35694/g.114788  ORF Transcript_35694/g.114788 Transcript_35694/m.114788 type:complete len:209 (-) Transcript_35694:492-1118(-)
MEGGEGGGPAARSCLPHRHRRRRGDARLWGCGRAGRDAERFVGAACVDRAGNPVGRAAATERLTHEALPRPLPPHGGAAVWLDQSPPLRRPLRVWHFRQRTPGVVEAGAVRPPRASELRRRVGARVRHEWDGGRRRASGGGAADGVASLRALPRGHTRAPRLGCWWRGRWWPGRRLPAVPRGVADDGAWRLDVPGLPGGHLLQRARRH